MSTATTVLPAADNVRRCVAGLLGSAVTAGKGTPVKVTPSAQAVVAVYQADNGSTSSAVAVDLEVGASIGAALTMIPARVAEEQVDKGKLDDMIYDNLREVMNVLASEFNRGTIHVRLVGAYRLPSEKVPPEVATLLQKPGGRLDMQLSVPNYGAGHVSIFVA